MKNPGIQIEDGQKSVLQQERSAEQVQEKSVSKRFGEKQSRRFISVLLLLYAAGVLFGALLFGIGENGRFWNLFIRAFLTDLTAVPVNQLLTNQLCQQSVQLLIAAFLGHCVLGQPLLWLCVIGKAAVHTSMICCALVQQVAFESLFLCHFLFELGCSAIYFFVLYLALGQSRRLLVISVLNKNKPAAFPRYWEKLLVMFLLLMCWCLLCSGVNYLLQHSPF